MDAASAMAARSTSTAYSIVYRKTVLPTPPYKCTLLCLSRIPSARGYVATPPPPPSRSSNAVVSNVPSHRLSRSLVIYLHPSAHAPDLTLNSQSCYTHIYRHSLLVDGPGVAPLPPRKPEDEVPRRLQQRQGSHGHLFQGALLPTLSLSLPPYSPLSCLTSSTAPSERSLPPPPPPCAACPPCPPRPPLHAPRTLTPCPPDLLFPPSDHRSCLHTHRCTLKRRGRRTRGRMRTGGRPLRSRQSSTPSRKPRAGACEEGPEERSELRRAERGDG